MKKLDRYIILENESIRNSIKKLDIEQINFLAISNSKKEIIGVFTMGDFRRYVLRGLDINENISRIINKKFKFLKDKFSVAQATEIFNHDGTISDLPVLGKNKELINVVYRSDYKLNPRKGFKSSLKDVPVVIMAGGKGKRLDPFTRVLPKSLIPIGNEPVIKIIMDKFKNFGFNKFQISINDKGQMIKSYFSDNDLPYKIKFIKEQTPLGTAGSLSKISNQRKGAIFVSNCDIVINNDYKIIYDFHVTGRYDLTLVASMRNYKIPYGVCNLDKNGKFKDIKEKPEYDFLVNTGMYIVNSTLIKIIPKNTYFDMTDLISKAKKNNFKIGVFPVSQESWYDIGQWSEYNKNVDKIYI
jgi:dTDP-glucose pyrophosphorylase